MLEHATPKAGDPCSFEGCHNTIRSTRMDICASHRRQQLRGEELRPLARKIYPVKNGRKTCRMCEVEKNIEEFIFIRKKTKTGKTERSPACNGCRKSYHKYSAIWGKYKLTKDEYDKMVQNGCSVCGSTEKIIVDHDHSCCKSDYTCGRCVRGILCTLCNTAIGYMQDDPNLIKKLAKYLEDYNNDDNV